MLLIICDKVFGWEREEKHIDLHRRIGTVDDLCRDLIFECGPSRQISDEIAIDYRLNDGRHILPIGIGQAEFLGSRHNSGVGRPLCLCLGA